MRDTNVVISRRSSACWCWGRWLTVWWCAVLQLTRKGSVLLRQVFEHLNLVDRQYFGLRFVDGEDDSESVRWDATYTYVLRWWRCAMDVLTMSAVMTLFGEWKEGHPECKNLCQLCLTGSIQIMGWKRIVERLGNQCDLSCGYFFTVTIKLSL